MMYRTLTRLTQCLAAGVLGAVLAGVAAAGGFQLTAEAPAAGDPQVQGAALVVRTYGCHEPSTAQVKATAEGIVDGQRRSIPLQLTLTDTGVFTIDPQWPEEGTWVVAITGTYRGMQSSLLVELGPAGQVEAEAGSALAQGTPRALTKQEVEQTLKKLAARQS